MEDEILSVSSDYDNPYTETASNWYHRHSQRLARRRNGLDSSSSDDGDESLDEGLHTSNTANDDSGDIIFGRWMESFPTVAARCSLFIRSRSGRKSVRDQEVKLLRRVLDKSSRNKNKNNEPSKEDVNGTSNEDAKYHRLVANSILPSGLGIKFVDDVLSRGASRETFVGNGQSSEQRRFCQTVLEISGPARSGMTSILITAAARYVANTSNLFLQVQDFLNNNTPNEHSNEQLTSPNTVIDDNNSTSNNKRQRVLHMNNNNNNIPEPQVVILDLDHGIHTLKLILSVRNAVLRRWEETSLGRKWRMQQQCKRQDIEANNVVDTNNRHQYDAYEPDAINEQLQIEMAISSCLGRIHVIQPRDFTYLTLVATIESLSKKLDEDKQLLYQTTHSTMNSTIQQPPTLLIIDSLSTLDACTRAQESLPTASGSVGGSGLSERNAFYRQLARLREEHEVAIMASCRHMNASDGGEHTSNIWDKMVTDKVGIHHVAEGTEEQRKGFEFVATVKNQHGDGSSVYPYSVASYGVDS